MLCKIGSGFWAFLMLATIAYSEQVGSPYLADEVSASQAQPDKPQDDKPKEPAKPPTTVKVTGRIVDRDRKGVASSEVTIAGPKGETKTTTDSSGGFAFDAVPGKYTITVKASGKSSTFHEEIGTGKADPLTLVVQ